MNRPSPSGGRLTTAFSALLVVLSACGAGASSAPLTAPSSSGEDDEAGNESDEAVGPSPSNRIRHGGRDYYLSGFNIAWFDFARDFGRGLDETSLRQAATDL